MKGYSPRFLLYAAVVVVAGAVAAAIGFAHPILPPGDLDTVAVLTGLLVITEMAPVTFLHRRHEMQVSTSTAFTLGILLVGGVGQALAAQMLALFFTEVKDRKHPVKVVFNVAQYAVSVVSAWGVQVGLGGANPLVHGVLPLRDAPVLAATAVTFLVVNNGLVWIAQSVNGGPPVSAIVADEWYFHAVTGVVLAGLAPVIALVAVQAIGLLPLLLIPVGAVYLSARSTLRQAHQARHDGLTGLPNRSRFLAAAEDALAEPGRSRDPLALLLIDLDRFKEINDTLGHHTGDLLLRQIGPRIQAAHRDISLVARLGGDEFAVLVAHAGGPDHAVDIARAITAALGRPIVLDDGLVLEVEASVGVVVTPEHGRDVETLIRRADVAMYLAKTARAGVELYAPDRDINTLRRLSLVGQLRAAIETGALTLHYQPKLDVARGEYTGVEALARWTDPELGPVTPDEFIPVAEQSGLIRPLTELVLRRAIGQAREWHDRGMALRVAVNLSARSFLDLELPATVSTLLAEVGLDPAFLELEITETELMSDPPRGARVLSRLHAMGVRLTIDDFGTGHSSLAYLRSLPVHEIKIDRCFVASMVGADRSTDDIIVRSTIELARNLGLEVTAEGVETDEQLATLTDLGCDYLQGFLLSRPVPPGELETFLEASSAVAATRRRAGDRPGRPDLRRVVRSD